MTFNAPTKTLAAAALFGAMACTMIACEQPKWDDPAYVGQRLVEKDPNVRKVALGYVEKMPEEQRRAMADKLSQVYLEKDANQKDIMKMLVVLRDPKAKDAYLEEIKTNATKYGGSAAEALGEIKATESIPAMLELLKKTDSNDVKQGILRGLSYMPDPQMVAPLIDILQLDADNYPIALHAYSCEILGKVAQDKPTAFDDAARQTLVKSIFLANAMSQNVANECGLAVQQLGKPAVPELVAVHKLESKPVQRLMMAYRFPKNRPRGVATTRLTGLRAAEAAPLFLEHVKTDHAVPQMLASNAEQKAAWLQMEVQTISEEILGLGDLKHKEALPEMIALMNGDKNKDWSAFMLDPGVQTQLRQDAAVAINKVGDRTQAPALLAMAKKLDANAELEKMAVYFESQKKPMKPIERYSFNFTAAREYAYLTDAAGAGAMISFIDGLADKGLQAELNKLKPALATQTECEAKGDAKAKVACYASKLSSQDEYSRAKAVYEIARLPSDVAAPALADALATDNLNTREIVTQALYQHPSKAAIAKIEGVLEKEKARKKLDYKLDRNRLNLALAWLKNNTK